ncbi:hypothetical protein QBC32DRAFT_350264 [Pseudoneurospora amorphoporcata]|uniref:Secreted protein n=1 Tax=Pseudoneurospora amorphoporcata TaxID=241081 RepID=A0AAN6NRL7_9PEZI|nr:hypothetical protein QBC32DRAFT_350264 [Pseudoneurospora amorphoporcata]
MFLLFFFFFPLFTCCPPVGSRDQPFTGLPSFPQAYLRTKPLDYPSDPFRMHLCTYFVYVPCGHPRRCACTAVSVVVAVVPVRVRWGGLLEYRNKARDDLYRRMGERRGRKKKKKKKKKKRERSR